MSQAVENPPRTQAIGNQVTENQSQFLRWYAHSDLDAPASRGMTRLIVLSLGLILTLLIVSATVAEWTVLIQSTRLEASPLAKSLWVGQPGVQEREFTEEKLQLLKSEIRKSLAGKEIDTIQRFSQISMKFKGKDESEGCEDESRGYQEWYGRTVEAGDQILSRLVPDVPLGEFGVVPTRELLTQLGYRPDETPEELVLRFNDVQSGQKVPVHFVVEVKLPYNLKFYLRRSDYNKLYLRANESRAGRMKLGAYTEDPELGAVTRDWPGYTELVNDNEFFNNCQKLRLEVPEIKGTRSEKYYYQLVPNDHQPLSMSDWEATVPQFRQALLLHIQFEQEALHEKLQQVKQNGGDLLDYQEPLDLESAVPDKITYDLAEVRVRELNDLKAAAVGCFNAGYPADETLVAQVDQINKIGRLLMVAVGVMVIGLLGIALIILLIIQSLRCELKKPEIGMLKAMGLSGREFLILYYHQAWILWMRGLWTGTLLAGLVTGVVGLSMADSANELLLLLVTFLLATFLLGVVSLMVVQFSLWKATRRSRLSDPMDTIRMG